MNAFRSSTTRRFWECLNELPVKVQDQAFKQYALFEENPFHRSLQFKETGRYWAVRISRGYRALAVRHDNDLTWFWIGPHDEYERVLRG